MEHKVEFVGAGVALGLAETFPRNFFTPPEGDGVVSVPLVVHKTASPASEDARTISIDVDEQAHSTARKCITYFGPNHNTISSRHQSEDIVHNAAWDTVLRFAHHVRDVKMVKLSEPQGAPTQMAFFSAPPQGRGVGLMRHALDRFYYQLGVSLNWYIPKYNPTALGITKTNHNILQGLGDSGPRFGADCHAILDEKIEANATSYRLLPAFPLGPGRADVVNIDDPQMP